MRLSWGMCSSFQMPRSLGVMGASGLTALASVRTRPAPPMARLPRWTKCQSLAKPSREVYSHMGEAVMRLRRVRPRSLRGAKRWFGGWVTVGWMWLEGVLHHGLIACGGLWWLIGKTAVFLWFLCGENVVECVVNVVKKQRVFGERIVGHLFRFYFLKVRGDPLRGAGGNFSGVFGVLFSGYAEAVMQTNMQTNMQTKRSLAVVAVLGMVLVSGCRIESDKHGDNDNVKIATPFGGMDIKTNDAAVVAEIGLPMYPGAVLVK